LDRRSLHRHVYNWVVDEGNGPVLPDTTAEPGVTKPLYNHTYGILDLGTGEMSYYQTPAWYGDDPGGMRMRYTTPLLRYTV